MPNDIENFSVNTGRSLANSANQQAAHQVKTAGHWVVQEFSAPIEMNKQFIHVRDFYNFIRSSSANTPAPFFYFSPNFYNFSTSVDLSTRKFCKR